MANTLDVMVARNYTTKKWEVLWRRDKVAYTRVPFCNPMRTATEALALARNSVNRLTPFKRNVGRGNAYYTALQQD